MSSLSINIEKNFQKILENLTEKEAFIIKNRAGINGKKKTLQEIGNTYGITRERVRQIQDVAIKKMGRIIKYSELVKIQELARETIDLHGGFLGRNRLISVLIQHFGVSEDMNRNIFDMILQSDFEIQKSKPQLNTETYFYSPTISKKLIQTIHKEAKSILCKKNDVMKQSHLYEIIRMNLKDTFDIIPVKLIDSILDVYKDIVKGDGTYIEMSTWNILNPKTLKEKALYIMRKGKKPKHFVDLSNEISEHFKHPVKVNTVHNEVIRSEDFILIGRGIYVLKEWGYKPGTVLDVIVDVLKKAKAPMTSDEIIKKVLKTRDVRTNTIYMNLQNKSVIARVGRNIYGLKES